MMQTQEHPLTLRKGEKLRHRQLVQPLFDGAESFFAYPLKLSFRPLSPQELENSFRDAMPRAIGSLQMMITVPKRKRRHAVDRVLMRRRIREAYRLNRIPLKELVEADPDIRSLSLSFIYVADTNMEFSRIQKRMRLLLSRLAHKLYHDVPELFPPSRPGS